MSSAIMPLLNVITSIKNIQNTPKAWNSLKPHLKPQISTQSEKLILLIRCWKNVQVYSKTSFVNLSYAIWSWTSWNKFSMLIMKSFLQKFLLSLPVILLLRFDFALESILILPFIALLLFSKSDLALSLSKLLEVSEKVFWQARLCC